MPLHDLVIKDRSAVESHRPSQGVVPLHDLVIKDRPAVESHRPSQRVMAPQRAGQRVVPLEFYPVTKEEFPL